MVRFMRKCYECATLVEIPQDLDDIALCNRHDDRSTAIILQFPSSLCSSEEEHRSVEAEVAVS